MIEIILAIIITVLLLFWSDDIKTREHALQAVRQYCDKFDLQLLDECVALNLLRLRRNNEGKMTFFRQYEFEFSATGIDRCKGRIKMSGKNIDTIQVDVHPIS